MAAKPYYLAGAARVDITPPLNIPYLGFSPRHCNFKGVHDRLYVRSAVISDGDNDIAIINADAIGFDNSLLGKGRNFTGEIREKINTVTGIPLCNIMFTAAHIHSTPDTLNFRPLIETPGAEAWLESLIDKIVVSVEEAKGRAFKARVKTGSGHVNGISVNRRGEALNDTELTITLFESIESSDCIILANYSCHPVIMQVQDMISGDFVGVFQSTVERVLAGSGLCLFLQGACGDINPKVNDSRNFDDANSTGLALAAQAEKIYGAMRSDEYPIHPVVVKAASKKLCLASRQLPSDEEREALSRKWNKCMIERSCTNIAKKDAAKLEEQYYRFKEGTGCYDAEVQAIRVGNCIFSAFSGELFCETGLKLKESSPPFVGMPVCYANGYVGYIAPEEAWAKGGYEVELGMWSKVGPESHAIVLDNLRLLIDIVKTDEILPGRVRI